MKLRSAILVTLVAGALLVAPARAQYRVFWGAPMGFRYCGNFSPALPVLGQATQLVAQLILSTDTFADPLDLDGISPSGDDVLLDQSIVTPATAGSDWGDFVGNTYTSATAQTGYLFGRVIAQPFWNWYGVFNGPMVDASLGGTPAPPFTYRFNTNGTDSEIGWSGCLSCLHPCPEPLTGIQPSNEAVTLSFQSVDANGTYHLQVSQDVLSGSWTNLTTNVNGLAIVSNQGPRAYFRVIKE